MAIKPYVHYFGCRFFAYIQHVIGHFIPNTILSPQKPKPEISKKNRKILACLIKLYYFSINEKHKSNENNQRNQIRSNDTSLETC